MDMKLQSKKCTLRGLGYHLHVAGDENAPCIILLHGLLDTGASFAPLIRALSTQIMARHWIAPDWRGHGNTDRAPEGYWFPDYLADLDALLQAVAPNQAVALVGHSMGGQVASMYAGAQPDAVSHLITLDSLNVPDAPIERTPERYRQWLAGLRKPLRERSFASITAIAARIARRYPELTSATCRWLAANWARKTADGRFCLAFDPRHRLPFPYGFRLAEAKALWREVRAPTLCLDAEQSRLQQGLDAA
ncbi:MAG TPA: alpha/beta fold hydrolase, partial [Salinisphaeraceae bacterium]|nr:alpha/beta fold hydrolase [Salinisphaeraceae bacterium]